MPPSFSSGSFSASFSITIEVISTVYLNAKIEITDPDGTVHTVGNELSEAAFSFSEDSAHTFDMLIRNPNNAFTLLYEKGCKVEVWMDKNTSPTTKRFRGEIEERPRTKPTLKENYLRLIGKDLFSIIILNRVVCEAYRNKKAHEIIQDLISKYAPEVDATTGNVKDVGTIEDIRFPYRTLKECLDQIVLLKGATYYCNPNLVLYLHKKKVEKSGISITESKIVKPEVIESIIPMKNRVYVIGSVEMKNDVVQDNFAGGSEDFVTYWWAQSFTPTRADFRQLSLYCKKLGIPPDDLVGEIREDKNGIPMGDVIKSIRFDREYVGTSWSWKVIAIEEKLVTGKKYWIVLKKVGDASNTYYWGKSDETNQEHAYSADGTNWTLVSNSFRFAFKTDYGTPIIAMAEDEVKSAKYRLREIVEIDPAITNMIMARELVLEKLGELSTDAKQLRTIRVRSQELSDLPKCGQTVNVSFPTLGLDEDFVLKEYTVVFEEGRAGAYNVDFTLGERRETLELIMSRLLKAVQAEKIEQTGIDTTSILNLIRFLTEKFGLSVEVVTTVKDVFRIETSLLDGEDRVG